MFMEQKENKGWEIHCLVGSDETHRNTDINGQRQEKSILKDGQKKKNQTVMFVSFEAVHGFHH